MTTAASAALEQAIFSLPKTEKHAGLLQALTQLCVHHAEHCPPYAAMLQSLWPDAPHAPHIEALPWLPVRLFKQLDLYSVPKESIARTLVSSGTTGAPVSRIHLDADTARAQTRALTKIFAEFAGNKRMPMLVIDNNAFMHDRSRFNARAAGILGFSNFGRDHHYLLDEALNPDWHALQQWLEKQGDQPLLLFGFTFIIWQSFVLAAQRDKVRLHLPAGSRLVHGGGWKKMVDNSVDNAQFKIALADTFNVQHVHNYYGMVEQVGSIFFECEHGHLHAPAYADIIIRDPQTLAPQPCNIAGLVQVLSLLPRSYPGHSLLTEDLGVLHGEDDCPCGRLGKHFSILGRIKNVEMRGCSDTRTLPSS
ncbi:acyl-protein synthetase [Lysobacteraceae bacterium NML71-0210]|nr:acyl-protein synthetase [Xanthomonadaceae bacterium NML71-0210]